MWVFVIIFKNWYILLLINKGGALVNEIYVNKKGGMVCRCDSYIQTWYDQSDAKNTKYAKRVGVGMVK